jgi:hypothetical protein
MTEERMAPAQALEKGWDSDLLRELIGYAALPPIRMDAEELVGAAAGEWGRGRGCLCNGYRRIRKHHRVMCIRSARTECPNRRGFRQESRQAPLPTDAHRGCLSMPSPIAAEPERCARCQPIRSPPARCRVDCAMARL